jgi:hypothetical protein
MAITDVGERLTVIEIARDFDGPSFADGAFYARREVRGQGFQALVSSLNMLASKYPGIDARHERIRIVGQHDYRRRNLAVEPIAEELYKSIPSLNQGYGGVAFGGLQRQKASQPGTHRFTVLPIHEDFNPEQERMDILDGLRELSVSTTERAETAGLRKLTVCYAGQAATKATLEAITDTIQHHLPDLRAYVMPANLLEDAANG